MARYPRLALACVLDGDHASALANEDIITCVKQDLGFVSVRNLREQRWHAWQILRVHHHPMASTQ
jgi:hypothetical protein